jgi:hypothetical protein
MPNAGGPASVVGSFSIKSHGARSMVTRYTSLTIAVFSSARVSKTGQPGYRIISGTATISESPHRSS